MTNGMRIAILVSQIPLLVAAAGDEHPRFAWGLGAVIVIFMAVIVLDSIKSRRRN